MEEKKYQLSGKGGVEIYIICSLCGGTGSGMFLDMAIHCRKNLVGQEESNITGVFLLPRIYTSLAGTGMVRGNAYGALKEIEHFNEMKLGEEMFIDYGVERVPVDRPPFDCTYLLDNENRRGKVINQIDQLVELVVQGVFLQLASQMGIEAANIIDNIKISGGMGRVGRLSTRYSSFGVGTLEFEGREYAELEALKFSKALIRDQFLGGGIPEEKMEKNVVQFIQNNKLKEDEANDVLDQMIELSQGGRYAIKMPALGGISSDKEAVTEILALKENYENKTMLSIGTLIKSNYDKMLGRYRNIIKDKYKQNLDQKSGVESAKIFLVKFKGKLEWYRRMMIEERENFVAKEKSLLFNTSLENIKSATKVFIGKAEKTRKASMNYASMIKRKLDYELEIQSRSKASEFFGNLITEIEKLINEVEKLKVTLESVASEIDSTYTSLISSRLRRLPPPFQEKIKHKEKGITKIEPKADEFVKWKRESISEWVEKDVNTVKDEILNFAISKSSELTEKSIEEVIKTEGIAATELGLLGKLSAPLCNLQEGKIPPQLKGTTLFIYGVTDRETSLLVTDDETKSALPKGEHAPTLVSTNDNQRIYALQIETNFPLYALTPIMHYKEGYDDEFHPLSKHIVEEWKNFPDILPEAEEVEKALTYFALALADPPFVLITARGNKYYCTSEKQGTPTEDYQIRLGEGGRRKALTAFSRNKALVGELEEKIESITKQKGVDSVITSLEQIYIPQLLHRLKGETKVTDEIKDLVNKEISAIKQWIADLKGIK